jgi:pyruvate ferredoxin oxidoreductase delta subunit
MIIGPIIAKPGSGVENKTGAWRTGLKPQFLQKNCVACRLCLFICPEGCITGDKKNTYTTNYDYCKGCGNCASVCKEKDIVMVSER